MKSYFKSRHWIGALLFVLLAPAAISTLVITAPASASTVSGVTVSADSYVANNTGANWSISFTPSVALSGMAFDTITVSFPSGFDVSGAYFSSVGLEFGRGF